MRRAVLLLSLSLPFSCAHAQDLLGSPIRSNMDMSSNSSVFAAMRAPVTGQPYQGVKVSHDSWKLSDGTTITHDSETQLARDGQGRVREELEMVHSASLGGHRADSTTQSITLADPVDHSMTFLSPGSKIAMKMALPDLSSIKLPKVPRATGGIMGGIAPPPAPKIIASASQTDASAMPAANAGAAKSDTQPDKVTTVDLGKQSLSGLLVTGKRVTTVIPLGKIGNDRPITIVHEEWYSPDLQIVVKSLDSDPRSGDRTVEVQNLTLGEPEASLFKVPDGYKVQDMAQLMKALGSLGRKGTQSEPK